MPIRIYQVGGYIQDDWKVNANLTISPALRIEHSSNPICVTNCFGQFAVPIDQIFADQTAPYNEELQVGRRNALLSLAPVQWEPRISFAWQPFGTTSNMFTKDLVILNNADGGHGKGGGTDGEGIGGGVYTLGTFTDPFTLIILNDASTSGDNIGP